MSFLSVVKSIGHAITGGVQVGQQLAPVIGSIPVFGAEANLVINAIAAIEGLLPQSGLGASKKAAVTAVVAAAHPTIDGPTLSAAIDAMVAALNALQAAAAKLPAS